MYADPYDETEIGGACPGCGLRSLYRIHWAGGSGRPDVRCYDCDWTNEDEDEGAFA